MFCVFHSFHLTGQPKENLFINSSTPLPSGETVRLLITDDYITNKVVTLCETTISDKHTFQLATTINQIHLAQLAIRTSRAEFFIVPDWRYPLEIEMDSVLFEFFDPGMLGGFLQIKNLDFDTNDLNLKINYFLAFYESLLQEYDINILYFKEKNAYDSVINELAKRFPLEYEPDNFYKSYIYYTVAQLDKVIYAKSPDLLYKKYFDNEYILYNNPAYMQFFRDFYSNYLYSSFHISKSMLNEYINNAPNYPALFNEVGKDRYLVNERLRELVLILNLWQYFNHEEFSQRNIVKLIEYIAVNTHFPEHKKIVDNILEIIENNQYGKTLPKFVFKNEKDKNVKINQFKGKWIYLHFYSNYCEECIREMLIIKELQEKFKDDITFVSISLDLDYNQFKLFKEEFKMFDWEFVHFNDQYEWLIAMDVYTLPENILLNPNGEIALRNAPDPNRELSLFLERLLYKEKDQRINPMFYRPNE
jgi:thiol-disulfide isomerase/thioredoxin